jgi:hypothetical protein
VIVTQWLSRDEQRQLIVMFALMTCRLRMSTSEDSMSEAIECPEHGPMERRYVKDVLVEVRCVVCGLRPIDLLQDRGIVGERDGP